ncbi:Glutathionyl-hydroquinone reductase [Streptococcus henryi]|uniref:Glutathionyl-hydroquinone reductase n=1 Tax=Streptococcus henryi TaxID=439219 RepID=A0A1G6B8L8_9STRE|nr:glutathione S-transferase C-terminal domain-containing protein [Streptococcus henryi]SDB16977.1 Glutathionyl-hydroquinone reductase [Streptococcus henryi]
MSYITPFQSVALFEQTFKHQINKETGKVCHRQFVFDKQFGDKPNELPVESDKYRLIWMPGCPHSNKAIITLRLLGLDRVISVGETGILRDPRGWVFSEDLGQVDPVLKIHYLDDAYLKGDPNFIGRSTVPAIIDIDTGKVVQNQAWDIPRYFATDWKKYHKENAPDLYPKNMRDEIDYWITFISKNVNAYACGFARYQEDYENGYDNYFEALDVLEKRLGEKRFVNGDFITLSDIHLFVALIRFHVTYHLIFGVNKKRLQDYPNLWEYTREIYQIPAFYDFTKLEWIQKHYQLSPHMRAKLGNVEGLVGTGPNNRGLLKPTKRDLLSSKPEHVFLIAKERRPKFAHINASDELTYLENYLIAPIKKASQAKFQTDLQRWSHQIEDAFQAIDSRLKNRSYLIGDKLSQVDFLLYQTLLRFDHIYYYLYKLDFAKTFDYPNLKQYQENLSKIEEVAGSIDISQEKREAFLDLDSERNPYGIYFTGPEDILRRK